MEKAQSARTGVLRHEKIIEFAQFAGLAGAGWVTDFMLLQIFTGGVGLGVGASNVLSSLIASLMVFLVARDAIFRKAQGRLGRRVATYAVYTLTVILVASAAASQIYEALTSLAAAWRINLPTAVAVALAKVIITPPQLLLNYLVSKQLVERR